VAIDTFEGQVDQVKHMEYPEFFARFYDIVYRDLRAGEDLDFYRKAISKSGGKVLEIGVGTGRLFKEALQDGADIHGIDISEAMLSILSKKLSQGELSRVSKQGIVDFQFDFQFDLIVAPFRVFSHVLTVEDQIRALNNIHKNLAQGGIFLFDLFVPDPDLLANGLERKQDYEGYYESGKKFRRIVSAESDVVNQITDVLWEIEWEDERGWHSNVWEMPFRFYFRFEVEHLVRLSKLSLKNTYGDFNKSALGPSAREMIFECIKG